MIDAVHAPQMAHIARLAAALDAVRAWSDAELDATPEAQEIRFVASRDGAYQAGVEVRVIGNGGLVLAAIQL